MCGCSNRNSPLIRNVSTDFSVNIKLLKEYYVSDSINIGYEGESLPKHIVNKRYDIQISLENNTDTSINIVLMKCSWEENFIINTQYIEYVPKACDSNYPHMIEIKPHEQFVLTGTLEKSKYIVECETCSEYSKSVILRLGLIYIPHVKNGTYFSEYSRIMEDKSLWNIIWSNPLNVEKL